MRSQIDSTKGKEIWRAAMDPKTGLTYYFDVVTRETQWKKPQGLVSIKEKRIEAERYRTQKVFFDTMESNILRCLELGKVPGTLLETEQDKNTDFNNKKLFSLEKPKSICFRTISSLDEKVMEELVHNKKSEENKLEHQIKECVFHFQDQHYDIQFIQTLENIQANSEPLEDCSSISHEDGRQNLKDQNKSEFDLLQSKPKMVARRNTCSTLYLGATISTPDVDATIKCVCAVYRSHVIQSIKGIYEKSRYYLSSKKYAVFDHDFICRSTRQRRRRNQKFEGPMKDFNNTWICQRISESNTSVPSLEEIILFYRSIFVKSQMEPDCVIMSLIYVEKLIKVSDGELVPSINNWKCILFCCMTLSSKVWDDLSMVNRDFIKACHHREPFNLQRINELEKATLCCLNYDVKVSASEYAKYYFLIRSMLIKSGMAGKGIVEAKPLTLDDAKKMEFNRTQIRTNHALPVSMNRRVKSSGSKRKGQKLNCNRFNLDLTTNAVLENVVTL